ncbi:DUF1850 domain-containing protein [Mesobacillus maritimus]|uniref:DUF1850 domain-containing protein n=1 Tax=Mesobacillus maritimus TaxID=1643336 RepID=UPI00203F496B|nr:DUF1850 domain-containing protein [Mesobacillus maritimus]MCM3667515.1 DUF1850 domain-containing protein [Mesobacillus maritimus]
MEKVKIRKTHFVLVLITVMIFISLFIPYKQALVFIQVETNRVSAFLPISIGETFKIKYTHSIHLSDVIESYEVVNQDVIRQFELEYENFGIGMPSEVTAEETFEIKDGKYLIKNMKRDFPSFILRIGQVRANHTLIYNKNSYPLSEFIEPGTRVKVQIKKLNVIQQLKGVGILAD